jgi:hypothetical protein
MGGSAEAVLLRTKIGLEPTVHRVRSLLQQFRYPSFFAEQTLRAQ